MIAGTAADLGRLLRAARLERGLSQQAVSDLLGVSRQWVVSAEKGAPTARVGLMLDALRAVGQLVDVRPEPADDAALAALRGPIAPNG
ncbi:MAG: helix-turn-helix domain-containing protein [Actinomycetia bacterium]|nr:helix-turn-helix domain-containing protein [Actinomycetes bacterium]